MTRKYYLALLLILCVVSSKVVSAEYSFTWYAGSFKPGSSDGSTINITLTAGANSLKLANRWVCEINSVSQLGARQTICKKGDDEVSFSVQCDQTRKSDRGQIRFKSNSKSDFIEVGCEIKQ